MQCAFSVPIIGVGKYLHERPDVDFSQVVIQSDGGDPIDHDEALAQAIQEATAMNPDMTVEKIEIHQTSQAE